MLNAMRNAKRNITQNDFLRIEFNGCCESLDLLEDPDELINVVTWILMLNRLGAVAGQGQTTIAANHYNGSLSVEIPFGESEVDEKNARNAVADLLGLFDPADHQVARVLQGGGGRDDYETDITPLALWPRKEIAREAARHS